MFSMCMTLNIQQFSLATQMALKHRLPTWSDKKVKKQWSFYEWSLYTQKILENNWFFGFRLEFDISCYLSSQRINGYDLFTYIYY